jgi:tRNA splicing endonuclease
VKGKGPREERETIINFNEAEDTASIWTASETVYRQLRKRGYTPFEDCDRHAKFEVMKRDVKLPRPKRQREMSQEHREAVRKALSMRRSLVKQQAKGT